MRKYVDVRPQKCWTYADWPEVRLKYLYPISFALALVHRKFFPNETKDRLILLINALAGKISAYCKNFEKPYPCREVVKDSPHPRIRKISK